VKSVLHVLFCFCFGIAHLPNSFECGATHNRLLSLPVCVATPKSRLIRFELLQLLGKRTLRIHCEDKDEKRPKKHLTFWRVNRQETLLIDEAPRIEVRVHFHV
jgi:hypothetical protein